jgi:phage terminase large subunit GpA-like protein
VRQSLESVGAGWLADQVGEITDTIEHTTPVEFNEAHRYLPESVTSMPGYIRYDVNPYMREIVDCFDVNSPVREVNLKKGVQITYSTVLESGALYFMAKIKTLPIMYMTADKELAAARIENNFIPMLDHSGFADIVRSSDTGNSRKTGKTANHIQFEGGGYLVPFGALNANKMRAASIAVMLKDEIDAWPDVVGKDGDPDALSDARCSGYWERRKIFRGSTPLIKGSSKIEKAYLLGDQRQYNVHCKHCGHQAPLRWETVDRDTGVIGGLKWDLDENGSLLHESVRYDCPKCGGSHYEYDKEKLFAAVGHGGTAEWVPTAAPSEPGIRSYHLPALYSTVGQPWYKCVADYLKAYDPVTRKVKDIGLYQVFYNNILAEPFEIMGAKISFAAVSGHRRTAYTYGTVPNQHAVEYAGSPILFLTMQVDIHRYNLAVAVMGWTVDAKCYVIDYWRLEPTEAEEKKKIDCTEIHCSVWSTLTELIDERVYTGNDGAEYRILTTLVDAGYSMPTAVAFCSQWETGVYPLLGRDRPAKNANIKEFQPFTTSAQTTGYKIVVDHYKDRIAPVLRREWHEGDGDQKAYHFNCPVDATDEQLRELTKETRRKKIDGKGAESYEWYRPPGARNELWDLLVYGHAAVEMIAVSTCIEQFELETVDWAQFWAYLEQEHPHFTPAE